jgi:hypothetical protein
MSRSRFHVGLILVTPFLQLLTNGNLFVTPSIPGLGRIDPWVYTGAFLSLPSYLSRFGGTYYITRLSWVLPGFAAHTLFPPLPASYVLHIAFFYGLMLSTYFLVRHGAQNATIAMFATNVLAWSPAVLVAMGWDYVDGAGITFLILSLCCFERAAAGEGRAWLWAMGGGASLACLVCANLMLVFLLPACEIFLLARLQFSNWRRAVRIACLAATGSAAMLGLFAGAVASLGGHWFFLAPSIQTGRVLISEPNNYRAAGLAWLLNARWLALVAVVTAVALYTAVRTRVPVSFPRAIQLTLLAAVVTWMLLDAGGNALLQVPYYVSYLTALALIALALQVNVPQPPPFRAVFWLEIGTVLIFAAGHLVILNHDGAFWAGVRGLVMHAGPSTWRQLIESHPRVAETAVAMTIAAVALWIVRRTRSPGLAAALIVAIVLTAGAGDTTSFWPPASEPMRQTYEQVSLAHRFIGRHVAPGHPLRFWYNFRTDDRRPLRSLCSSYLWMYVLLNENLPAVTKSEAALLTTGTRLVLLLPAIDQVEMARSALKRMDVEIVPVAERVFGAGATSFAVVVTDVVRAPLRGLS